MFMLALALFAADTTHSVKVPVNPSESLYVEITGQGEPVVLIPGLFGAAFGFRNLVPRIVEAGYQGVVVEPLGIGFSSRPPGADYSLDRQSERIATAIHSLGFDHVVIVA